MVHNLWGDEFEFFKMDTVGSLSLIKQEKNKLS